MKTIKEAADSLLLKGEITKDEYSALEKNANFNKEAGSSELMKLIKDIVFPIAAAGAIGVAGKELIYDPIKRRSDIKNSFNLMSEKVPQLAEKNQTDMQDYFNVVKTFSPKAASNPLVAGALVNKMMEFGGVDHKLVQDISAIEAGMQRPSTIQQITEATAKSLVGIPKE